MYKAICINDGQIKCKTADEQIESWALVGKAALDNPDLPINFVRDLLNVKAMNESKLTPFKPKV